MNTDLYALLGQIDARANLILFIFMTLFLLVLV